MKNAAVQPARKLRLDYLQALLAPPLDGVRKAMERIARGEDIEEAARAAGPAGR